MLAHLGLEDVDDHVVQVDQHPAALFEALDSESSVAPLLHGQLDGVGDRAHVAIGAAGEEDECVGKGDDVAHVEYHRVVCLPVDARGGGRQGFFDGVALTHGAA